MKGGNANTLPLEYFGGDSGRYSVNPPAPGNCAYGQVIPQSFGMPISSANATGPNLCVYPNGAPTQTGGYERRRRRRGMRKTRRNKKRSNKRNKSANNYGNKRVSRKTSRRRRKCSCDCPL